MQASSGRADVADRTWPKPCRRRLELAVVPSAVRIARHWTADQLAAGPGAKAADADLVDTAVLVVSELVTNAIRAVKQSPAPGTTAAGPYALAGRILSFADLGGSSLAPPPPRVWLVIVRFAAVVRIEVHDSSLVPLPPARASDEDDESGRGLTVVSALAQTWGWQPERAGKVVWCELAG
jgi:anti-sigma regulatory factor (Ser/Thr protein kinase)